jgi:hypothetical protein
VAGEIDGENASVHGEGGQEVVPGEGSGVEHCAVEEEDWWASRMGLGIIMVIMLVDTNWPI